MKLPEKNKNAHIPFKPLLTAKLFQLVFPDYIFPTKIPLFLLLATPVALIKCLILLYLGQMMHKNNHTATLVNHNLARVEGTPPANLMIFPKPGEVTALDGREFQFGDYDKVVADFKSREKKLPIDINHSEALKAPEGDPSPAVGWITDLYISDEELWAVVEWTDEGRWLIENGSYKYYSPFWFSDKKTGLPTRLISVSLVNVPALDVPALARAENNSTQEEIDIMDEKQLASLAGAIGLPNNATADAIIAAAKEGAQALAAQQKAEFIPVDDHRQVLARAEAAEKELQSLKDEQQQAAANSLVDAATEAGKVVPASREFWLEACKKQGLDAISAHFESLGSSPLMGELAPKDPAQDAQKSEADINIARMLGIDEEENKNDASK